jgi:hypothetical protein
MFKDLGKQTLPEGSELVRSLDTMEEAAFAAFVRELNDLADEVIETGGLFVWPFSYVNYGNSFSIQCFDQTVWDSENSVWDVDRGETLREHILGEIDTFFDAVNQIWMRTSRS